MINDTKEDLLKCRNRVNPTTPETHLDTISKVQNDRCEQRRRKEDLEELLRMEKEWELDCD